MIPKSKILRGDTSNFNGLKLQKDVHKTSQVVNVVVERGSSEVKYPEVPELNITPHAVPYSELPVETPPGQLPVACADVAKLNEIIRNREDFIKGLQLILKISRENPLYINKFIISRLEDLKELIRLFTTAEEVDIQLNDEDVNCFSCGPQDYYKIHRIYISYLGGVYDLSSHCADCIRYIEDSGISLKFIKLN